MRHMFPGFCAMACKLLLMRTLLSTSLLDQRTHPVIEKFDFRANTLAQFTWSQVDVQAGGVRAFLIPKQRDVIPGHPPPFSDSSPQLLPHPVTLHSAATLSPH